MYRNGNTLYAWETVRDNDGFVKECRVHITASKGRELQFRLSVPDLN
ncbi:Uncharacterised protein [Mycobacteroides abscessus subsp. massiliense]|nr:Uncharacterised protein [Mycobacteroides abscessus subsp. massiliense]SKV38979.1 Uncharacterised protein [Mycobacteroides abscessus subsp. massiliense]